MDQPAIIGIDISKSVFQLHAATEDGSPVLRKQLTRGRFLPFLAELPECLVVMEACGGAHQMGRRIKELGRECQPVPPVHAFAPPMESFRSGRGSAAYDGLTPRQPSTAGRLRLGRIAKMGQRDVRNLLVLGADIGAAAPAQRRRAGQPAASSDDRGETAKVGCGGLCK